MAGPGCEAGRRRRESLWGRNHFADAASAFERHTCLGPGGQGLLAGIFCAKTSAKNPPAVQETQVRYPGREEPLVEGMVAHSGILAWEVPWTEEPGGLQAMGSQRVRHD